MDKQTQNALSVIDRATLPGIRLHVGEEGVVVTLNDAEQREILSALKAVLQARATPASA